jgi:glycosyltransferase involved in cell wall biosynthesis
MTDSLPSPKTRRRFPRLLIATEFGPDAHGGGGSLMRQLLRGFPNEQISWWSCHPELPRQTQGLPVRHFHYPAPARLYPYRRLAKLKSVILELIWVGRAVANLKKTIAIAQPDRLWFNLHTWAIPVIQRAYPALGLPFHVSLWDYPDVETSQPVFGKQRLARWRRTVEAIVKSSTSCDVISESMREDIARRTGRGDAIIVHSGFEPSDLEALNAAQELEPDVIRIAYAGSIMAPRAMERVVDAFQAARQRMNARAQLDFFGGGRYRAYPWFDPACMREHPHLDEAAFHSELRRCTWGLVTMDLNDDTPRYNRFSFPNKFGTFVAAGLPLIVFAHKESSVARLMTEYPVGVCAGANMLPELTSFWEAALRKVNPRAYFRDQLLRCAATEFNMPAMRERLWNVLGVMPKAVSG